MKLLKSSFFALAVLVSAAAALSTSFVSEAKAKSTTISYVWLKYDCALGTPSTPVPILATGNYLTTDAQATSLCANSNEIVCARKFPVSSNPAVDGQQPIVIVNGQAQFNPEYDGEPAEGFVAERKCPLN